MFGSIFTNFISTFFGVLIAFGITFFYDRWKKRNKEMQEIKNTLSAIRAELESNLKYLQCESHPNMAKLTRFNQLVLESSVQTGIFSLFPTDLQIVLSEIYRNYQHNEMWVNKLFSLEYNWDKDKNAGHNKSLMEKVVISEHYLCDFIPKTISKIDDELKRMK